MTNPITHKLENESIGTLLLHYAIPAVVGTMVNSLYNIVDRIFIGQGVGAYAISGLTLTFPIFLFLQAFGMLIGAGAASRISIFLGKKDIKMAELVLGNALILSVLFSLLTIIPSMIFMKDLLVLFGGSEYTIPYAAEYLYIAIPGNLFATLSFSFNSVMRASGYPRKAMLAMLLGAGINVVLDYVFIIIWGMGIKGAAIATVISMFISATYVMSHFVNKESLVRFKKGCFRLKWPVLISIISIGIAPFSMQIAASLVSVILNYSLYSYGGDFAIGANGIITSVGLLFVMLIVGIAQGMQPIVGYNYGAGLHQRAMATLRLVVITATCVTGLGWICSQFIPDWIVKAFTLGPELIKIAANGLRLNMLLFFVVGSQITISQFFQSIGKVSVSIFLSLSRQCLFLIPCIFILPPFFGLNGVWYASPVSDLMASIFAWLFLIYHVKNMKNSIFH